MSKLPLEGIFVLDFATLIAAPVSATLLGDFGATVIKIEQPRTGDPVRGLPLIEDGRHTMWMNEARNKKTVTLDLRTEPGQQLAKRLAAKADAALLNFRPGQAEDWNIGPEELHKVNPDLIILQVSAYGQTGPLRTKGGFDRTISAYAGLTYVTGYPDRPPVRSGYALVDYMTAYLGAFGVMLALYNREVNGSGGEVIDASLTEAAFRASESALLDYSLNGRIRERVGNRNMTFVPAEDFETKDGRILVINAGTDALWKRLARAIGRPELAEDERFKYSVYRVIHQEELYAIITDWAKTLTAAEALKVLDENKVPADIIRDIGELAHEPHLREREAVLEIEDPEKGRVLVPGVFPKLAKSPGRIKHLGPRLGAHNDEIYGDFLGLSQEELTELKEKGVI